MDASDGPELILLSDLHLGAERGRGLFRADTELAAFLRWVAEETGPARVVIAGDFLDFLVPRDGEESVPAFDPHGAMARAGAIVEHHPEVFDGLARLVSSPRHELWILSGNHDPELLLPDVREVLHRRLGLNALASSIRWRTEGEAAGFQVGPARVLVAHGDCFDDVNRIEHGTLRTAVNRLSYGFSQPKEHEYEPPLGTRLVVEHVLGLRSRYPWVDALKPEREAVFPVLNQFLSFAEKKRFRKVLWEIFRSQWDSFWSRSLRKSSPETLVRANEADSPRERLRLWLEEEASLVRSSSEDRGEDLIPRLRQVSAEDGSFDLFAPDACTRWVPLFLDRGADLVVMGHTHAAKALPLERGLYLNSGSWGRLLPLPESAASEGEWKGFLADLHAGRDLGEARPTWVRVERDARGTRACLMEWKDSAAESRAFYRFEPENRHWKREG